jgi:hypothetical protein
VRTRLETGDETAEADLAVSDESQASRAKRFKEPDPPSCRRQSPREACSVIREAKTWRYMLCRGVARLIGGDGHRERRRLNNAREAAHGPLGSFTQRRPSPSLRHEAYLDLVSKHYDSCAAARAKGARWPLRLAATTWYRSSRRPSGALSFPVGSILLEDGWRFDTSEGDKHASCYQSK